MSPEITSRHDHITATLDSLPSRHDHITATLDSLSSRPLASAELKSILPAMRETLSGSGINLELSEGGMTSLREPQFRNLETGRGVGVVEALGSLDRAQSLLNWCQENGGTAKIGGKEGTQGRGLRQLVADTILLLATPEPTDEQVEAYVLRLNRRIKRWAEHKSESRKSTVEAYQSIPRIEPEDKWKDFASADPHKVSELWIFLTSRSDN